MGMGGLGEEDPAVGHVRASEGLGSPKKEKKEKKEKMEKKEKKGKIERMGMSELREEDPELNMFEKSRARGPPVWSRCRDGGRDMALCSRPVGKASAIVA